MRKFLKWTGILILLFIVVALIGYFIYHEPMPQGQSGPEADALARQMETTLGKTAWDSTRLVKWCFAGMHCYLWDKDQKIVEVRWDQNRVLLRTQEQTGVAFQNDIRVNGQEAHGLVAKAWSFFCNDSFWLAAPFKAFDEGTSRSIVDTEEGPGLLVQYSSGGVTPGDAYLYTFDDKGFPTSWKLWVNIIPVGGLVWTWEDYQATSLGAQIATMHQGLKNVVISDLTTAQTYEEMGMDYPFGVLH